MADKVVRLVDRGAKAPYLDPNASHARIYADWRHLDAFTTLTPLQRVILEDTLMSFSRLTGNEVRLTGNGVAQKYCVGHRTAREAIAGLEERGWIERIGLSPGPTGQAGGLYRIQCLSPRGIRAAGPYMRWRATD